jgi:hypothetical protein
MAAVLLASCLAWAAPARAQTTAPPPRAGAQAPAAESRDAGWTISATLEAYYQWNTNRPADRVNYLRAYDTRSSMFALQQAAAILERAPDVAARRRAGLRLDLQFGQATETVQGSAANEPRPDVYRHVWQAYGTYVFPWRSLTIDVGKFASNLGFETNYAKDNAHFSRAFLFNFLPFYHAGVRATLPLGERLTVSYMITNGVQQTEDFNSFKASHVTAVVRPVPRFGWTTSYFFGREQPDGGQAGGPDGALRIFDSYVTYDAGRGWSFGADVNHTSNAVQASGPRISLTGAGLYARVERAGTALALRYERLQDRGALFGQVPQRLAEATVTVERRLDEGLIARLEYRRDGSTEPVFPSRRGRDRTQPTWLVGLVWWAGKTGPW